MKACGHCKIEKPFECFGKHKKGAFGLRAWCKECRRIESKERRIKAAEYNRQYFKMYGQIKAKELKEYRNKYYQQNKETISLQHREYAKANADKLRIIVSKQRGERYRSDSLFKLKMNLRTRLRIFLTSKGFRKNKSTESMLGCSYEDARLHIEKQFKPGMTWDNHGKWHVDHIIPLATANTTEDAERLCHYTNLQPLWANENLSKGAKAA